MSTSSRHFVGGILNCLYDVHIARTTTEITRNRVTNFIFSWMWILCQQRTRSHHHTRCAETALQSMFLMEALLDRMQCSVRRKTFHSLDFHTIGLHGKNGT